MKKLALIVLSCAAIYTAQANEATILATQRANLDNKLQLFNHLAEQPDLGSIMFAWSVYIASGSAIGYQQDKTLLGTLLGFATGLVMLSIELNYRQFLEAWKLELQCRLYEADKNASAITNRRK